MPSLYAAAIHGGPVVQLAELLFYHTYTMQRIISLLLCVFLFAGLALAQPQANFTMTSIHLGEIQWKHAGLAAFSVVNMGDEDLVIESVHPDCGCVAVEWTNVPIPPGETGVISVSYNAEMLGTFSKGVEVKTNAFDEPAYLVLTGKVVNEKKDYSGDFSHRVGDIYLNTKEMDFGDVHRGTYPGLAIMVYNGSDLPYAPNLMHLPKYLTASYQPELLQPGGLGRIIVGLNTEKLSQDGLLQTMVYLSRFPGDRVKSGNEIEVSAVILPEVAASAEASDMAPVLEIDTTTVDLRSNGGLRKKTKAFLLLYNAGGSPLVVSALQVYEPGVSVSLGKRKISAGRGTRLKISVPSDFANEKGFAHILLITNDPKQSKVVVKLLVNKK